jgi:hypothetical protein
MPKITKIVFLQSPEFNKRHLGRKWYNVYLYDNGEMTVSWGVDNNTHGTRTRKKAGERLFYDRIEDKIFRGYKIREIR